jgi:DNA-binding transcriptional MerR regulator
VAARIKKGFWLRARVARELGVHITRVRQLEKAGTLVPTIDKDGVRLYDPRAVKAFAKKRAPRLVARGEDAANVFRMLDDGHNFKDIVIATRLAPEVVRKLHDEYRRPLVEPPPDRELEDFDRRNAETDEQIKKQRARAAGGEHLT